MAGWWHCSLLIPTLWRESLVGVWEFYARLAYEATKKDSASKANKRGVIKRSSDEMRLDRLVKEISSPAIKLLNLPL